MSFMKRLLSKKPKLGVESKLPSSTEHPLQVQLLQSQHQLPGLSLEQSIAVRETQALEALARGVSDISRFLNGGGLASALSLYAKASGVNAIAGGLAAHDGRSALDARVLGQNALESVTQIGKMYDQLQEKLQWKINGEVRDEDIKDSEADYRKWKEEVEKKK